MRCQRPSSSPMGVRRTRPARSSSASAAAASAGERSSLRSRHTSATSTVTRPAGNARQEVGGLRRRSAGQVGSQVGNADVVGVEGLPAAGDEPRPSRSNTRLGAVKRAPDPVRGPPLGDGGRARHAGAAGLGPVALVGGLDLGRRSRRRSPAPSRPTASATLGDPRSASSRSVDVNHARRIARSSPPVERRCRLRAAALTARQARPDAIRRVRGVLGRGIPNRHPNSCRPRTRLRASRPPARGRGCPRRGRS